jgi:uncharacterized protein (TIGR03437 family)
MLNAASFYYRETGILPAEIARGAMFIIQGKDLGPDEPQRAQDYSTLELAGTSVSITGGGITRRAAILYTSYGLVAGILSPDIPSGEASFSLNYFAPSVAQKFLVVDRAFGIFTQSGDANGPAIAHNVSATGEYRLNTYIDSARPGDVVVLWGTGIGQAVPDANVLVGGKPAKAIYAGPSGCCKGLDQVIFKVPEGVEGCFAPLAVDFGTEISRNFGAISISAQGAECSDPHGYPGSELDLLKKGQHQRLGSIFLSGTTTPGGMQPDFISGYASFWNDYGFGSNVPLAIPFGSCTVRSYPRARFPLVGAIPIGSTGVVLLVGAITLHGPQGTTDIPQFGSDKPHTLPWIGGTYTVENGAGGPDAGPFQASVEFPAGPVQFTNLSQLGPTVDASRDLKITWSGGGPGYISVSGSFEDGPDFRCMERADRGSLTIPAAILKRLILSNAVSTLDIAVLAYGLPVRIEARGLDFATLQSQAGYAYTSFFLK